MEIVFEMLKLLKNIANNDNKVSNKSFKTILAVNVEKMSIESHENLSTFSLLGVENEISTSVLRIK